MAVPDFQTLMLPVLKLSADGQKHSLAETVERMSQEFQLSEADRGEVLKSGQTRIYNRVAWTTTYLRKAGVLQSVGPGKYQITERGRDTLASQPTSIDIGYLTSRFPELADFRKARPGNADTDDDSAAVFDESAGKWRHRIGVEKRVREIIELLLPQNEHRRAVLEFFAYAIENADEEKADSWCLKVTDQGLRLMAGRLLACEITPITMRASVLGPIDADVRKSIGADTRADEDFNFRSVADGILLAFPSDHAGQALEQLRDPFNSFVDLAMARVKSHVSLEDHCPEAVAYVASIVGRELPQPKPTPEEAGSESDTGASTDEEPLESRVPKTRGRAPIFGYGQQSIASLMSDIERGIVALPDLQRPFVWEDTKVRNLLDSLFIGFPVGTLVFWHVATEKETREIGSDKSGLRATTLVIDGQQRLTSLYAVMRGVEVIGKDGAPRNITIAFRPRDGRFEVADAAIRNDPEFIPNVTELWSGKRSKPQIKRDLKAALEDKGRVVDQEYQDAVEHNLDRAYTINEYVFPTVEIRKTTASQEITEEDVAEIFVRINNQGTRLGQADFVLTLLSVFLPRLRDRIEDRARSMSQGTIIQLDSQQLLRGACAVAFGRARMSAIYRFLRGIDPSTGDRDVSSRSSRLDQLEEAADRCLDPTPWRDFLLCVQHAGFVTPALIPSKNAVVNAYAFYVRGSTAGVPKPRLDGVMTRWIFGTLLTARYSTSSESAFENDLARVIRLQSADPNEFVMALDDALAETITGDYWRQVLVSALDTQKTRAPSALAFRAAQVVINARALFSEKLLRNLLDPPADGGRSASEAHHLYPIAWLAQREIADRRWTHQVANLADAGWYENAVIGSRSPAEYVPRLREKLGIDDSRWGRMCAEHALPPGWESMDYDEFLRQRRARMADIIHVAFRMLGGETQEPPLTPPWFLPGAEAVWQLIGQTERGLRRMVREVYSERFGEAAAKKIEESLPEREREVLSRALRSRPAGAEPLSVVDYLYLSQLPVLLFRSEVWAEARVKLGGRDDAKRILQEAITHVVPVRNEIAHIREVDNDRLLRATVGCNDVLRLLPTKR